MFHTKKTQKCRKPKTKRYNKQCPREQREALGIVGGDIGLCFRQNTKNKLLLIKNGGRTMENISSIFINLLIVILFQFVTCSCFACCKKVAQRLIVNLKENKMKCQKRKNINCNMMYIK